jgi:hypothetical protein
MTTGWPALETVSVSGYNMPEIHTGVNIYAMGDYNCPAKNVVYDYDGNNSN